MEKGFISMSDWWSSTSERRPRLAELHKLCIVKQLYVIPVNRTFPVHWPDSLEGLRLGDGNLHIPLKYASSFKMVTGSLFSSPFYSSLRLLPSSLQRLLFFPQMFLFLYFSFQGHFLQLDLSDDVLHRKC